MRTPLIAMCGTCLVSLVGLSSCVREIELDYASTEPTLVVNSVLSPQQNVAVRLSQTLFVSDAQKTPLVEKARVALRIDHGAEQLLQWQSPSSNTHNEGSIYTLPVRVTEGQHVSLEVATPQGQKASASGIMPRWVSLQQCDFSYIDRQEKNTYYNAYDVDRINEEREISYTIVLNDPAKEHNYYLIQVLDEKGRGVNIDYSRNDLFIKQLKSVDRFDAADMLTRRYGLTFDDTSFEGQTFKLRLIEKNHAPDYYGKYRRTRYIRLYSLSKDYYLYLSQLLMRNEFGFNDGLIEVGLADPPRQYNNIVGGVGILGLMQRDEKQLEVGGKEEEPPYHY